jgi:hypothetical protein
MKLLMLREALALRIENAFMMNNARGIYPGLTKQKSTT